MNNSTKNNFSLIEVLVALTIIAICFTVLMSALSLNIKNTGIAKSYITANLLAKRKIVALVSSDKIKNGKKNGEFGDKYPGFKWKTDVKRKSKYLYSIKLSISFIRGGEERTLIFKTLSLDKKALKKASKKKKGASNENKNKNLKS